MSLYIIMWSPNGKDYPPPQIVEADQLLFDKKTGQKILQSPDGRVVCVAPKDALVVLEKRGMAPGPTTVKHE